MVYIAGVVFTASSGILFQWYDFHCWSYVYRLILNIIPIVRFTLLELCLPLLLKYDSNDMIWIAGVVFTASSEI
jgi:hypothetical protein